MASEPTEAQILNAVEKAGFLLEQQTATKLEGAGYTVATNVAFVDPDENRSRELDVLAKQVVRPADGVRVHIELLVDCKRNDYPFVFLRRGKTVRERERAPGEFVFPTTELRKLVGTTPQGTNWRIHPHFRYLGLDSSHYYYSHEFQCSQVCAVTRKGKEWEAVHGDLVSGITFPLAKALVQRREWARDYLQRSTEPIIWLYVPLVVVTGPLYEVDTESAKLGAREVQWSTLAREIKTRTMDDTFVFDFVTDQYLATFLQSQLGAFVARVAEVARWEIPLLRSGEIPPER